MIQTIVGIAIGAAITWFASWYYYRKAGQELSGIAADLKKTGEVFARYVVESQREPETGINRDEHGNAIGVSMPLRAKFEGTSSMTADLTVAKNPQD